MLGELSVFFFFASYLLSRVSSVLNRDSSQYGKKFMFDKNEDTCWNSDQVSLFWTCIWFYTEHTTHREIWEKLSHGPSHTQRLYC